MPRICVQNFREHNQEKWDYNELQHCLFYTFLRTICILYVSCISHKCTKVRSLKIPPIEYQYSVRKRKIWPLVNINKGKFSKTWKIAYESAIA